MASALFIIGVMCTVSVPLLLAAAAVRLFNRRSVKLLIHGVIIMLILAVSAFILNSMLKGLQP